MVKASVPMLARRGIPTMSPVMAVDPVVAPVPRAEARRDASRALTLARLACRF